MTEKKEKRVHWTFFIPAGLALLLYIPFMVTLFIAVVLAWENSILQFMASAIMFLVALLYPVGFFMAIAQYKGSVTMAEKRKAVSLPYWHAVIVFALMIIAALVEAIGL